MKMKNILVAMLALSGCVTETSTVATKPLTGAEAQVYNLFFDSGINSAIAQSIADDCPRLAFSKAAENQYLSATADKGVELLNGDAVRAEQIADAMADQAERELRPQVEERLLAYVKAQDYLPGSADQACRVGNEERARGSAIGRMLVAQ
jgi:hypothetical protein